MIGRDGAARGPTPPRARALVEVTTRGGPHPGVSAAVVARRAKKMLTALGLRRVELSIALVDDATIRGLNKRHRKKDKPTDVLSFPLLELAPGDAAEGALGDVVISVPTARRQAGRRRRPLLDELTMLLAHGILHLLGHDHRDDAEEREMTARTRALEAAARARTAGGKARPGSSSGNRRKT